MSLPTPSSDPVSYPQIRDTLQTGDLLLFSGHSLLDYMIETLGRTAGEPPYSHVGMVIRDGAGLYFWDAPGGGETFPDPYSVDPNNRNHSAQPTAHSGCRVAPLDPLLAYYAQVEGGHFWLRRLQPKVTATQFEALRIFINRVDGLPFPTPVETALAANYAAGQAGITLYAGTYFCAQLVADSYLHMGLLSADRWPANSYSPSAFASTDPRKLPFVRPSMLGEPIDVIWKKPG